MYLTLDIGSLVYKKFDASLTENLLKISLPAQNNSRVFIGNYEIYNNFLKLSCDNGARKVYSSFKLGKFCIAFYFWGYDFILCFYFGLTLK